MTLRQDVEKVFALPPVNAVWVPGLDSNAASNVPNARGIVQCIGDNKASVLVFLRPDLREAAWAINLLSLLMVVAGWKNGPDKWLNACFTAANLSSTGGTFKTVHHNMRYEIVINRMIGIADLQVTAPGGDQPPLPDNPGSFAVLP